MPHKHVRRKGDDLSHFNLAPSVLAKPLAARNSDSKINKQPQKSRLSKFNHGKSASNGYKHDDTPRAFARMIALQTSKKRQRSGLDDGEDNRSSKKKQRKSQPTDISDSQPTTATEQPQPEQQLPKILPGERLSDFAARVDRALPVANLARKGKVNVEGIKERQTKTEKRLQKMYASWREEETRLKEKEEERQELEEEAEEERGAAYGGQTIAFPTSNRGAKRKKKGTVIGEVQEDEDPWAELERKREVRKGLHDVVQAPPTFKTVPKEKFKVKEGARVDVGNVPKGAGSLMRREELGGARREVIQRYREMMGRKK